MDYVYKEDLVQKTVTGSTSYSTITSTSNLISGNKYAIFVNSQFGGNDTSFLFGIRIKSGDGELLGSTRVREMNSVVHEQSYSYMTMITSDGSPIDIQIKTFNSAKTARVEASTILCIDITDLTEGTHYFFSEDTTESTNTSSYNERNVLNIPTHFDTEGDWLVVSHVETDINDNTISNKARVKSSAALPDVEIPLMSQEGEDTAEFTSEYMQNVISVPSPAVGLSLLGPVEDSVVSLETADEFDTINNNVYKSSRMFALKLGVFDHFDSVTNNTFANISTPGSFEEAIKISRFTPPGTSEEVIIMGYTSFIAGSINKHIHTDITIAGSESLPGYGDNVMHRSFDSEDELPTSIVSLEPSIAADSDIVMRIKGYSTGAGINYSNLCAMTFSNAINIETVIDDLGTPGSYKGFRVRDSTGQQQRFTYKKDSSSSSFTIGLADVTSFDGLAQKIVDSVNNIGDLTISSTRSGLDVSLIQDELNGSYSDSYFGFFENTFSHVTFIEPGSDDYSDYLDYIHFTGGDTGGYSTGHIIVLPGYSESSRAGEARSVITPDPKSVKMEPGKVVRKW